MAERKTVTLRDILYIFFKNKQTISFIFFTALIVSTIYVFSAVPLYRAETKLLVKMGKEQFSALEDYSGADFNILFQQRAQNINNEIEIIKGPELTNIVLPKLKQKLASRPIIREKTLLGILRQLVGGALGLVKRAVTIPFELLGMYRHLSEDQQLALAIQGSLDVEYIEETDILEVTSTWPDPEFAAFAVNTIATEYLYLRNKVHTSADSYQFYVDQITFFNTKLKEAEDELQAFVEEGNISNIEMQKNLLLQNISELEAQYNQAAISYQKALIRHNKVKQMIDTPGSWIETPDIGTDVVDKQAYLQELDRSYFKLRLEREQLLKVYTPQARAVVNVDRQMANIRKQKADSLMNILGIELETARRENDMLHDEYTEHKERLEKLTALTLRLEQLQRDREILKDHFMTYQQKAEDLRIFDDLDKRKITSVKVIHHAVPPLKPVFPKRMLIISLAAFFALFLGFGFCAISEFFNHTFKDDLDVADDLGIPLLMTVSYIGGAPPKQLGQPIVQAVKQYVQRLGLLFRKGGGKRTVGTIIPLVLVVFLLLLVLASISREGVWQSPGVVVTPLEITRDQHLSSVPGSGNAGVDASRSGVRRKRIAEAVEEQKRVTAAAAQDTAAAAGLDEEVAAEAPLGGDDIFAGDDAFGLVADADAVADEAAKGSGESAPAEQASLKDVPQEPQEQGAARPETPAEQPAPASVAEAAPDEDGLQEDVSLPAPAATAAPPVQEQAAAAPEALFAEITKPSAGQAQAVASDVEQRQLADGDEYYTVQVSTESTKPGADLLVAQLTGEGYPAYIEQYRTAKGRMLYKVRFGYYGNAARAAAAAAHYRQKRSAECLVVRSKHEAASTGAGDAHAAAAPSSVYYYTLQINSYRSPELAAEEVEACREKGLEVELVKQDFTDSGVWYKVRAGKFASRSEAEAGRLKHNISSNATIVRCEYE